MYKGKWSSGMFVPVGKAAIELAREIGYDSWRALVKTEVNHQNN